MTSLDLILQSSITRNINYTRPVSSAELYRGSLTRNATWALPNPRLSHCPGRLPPRSGSLQAAYPRLSHTSCRCRSRSFSARHASCADLIVLAHWRGVVKSTRQSPEAEISLRGPYSGILQKYIVTLLSRVAPINHLIQRPAGIVAWYFMLLGGFLWKMSRLGQRPLKAGPAKPEADFPSITLRLE